MVLLAGFASLLHRYSGQPEVVVGAPVAGRSRAEIEGLIGFFVNSLVLRVDCGGDPSFRELVGRVREVVLGAFAHQELPFERLVEELQPERDLSRNPLFQVTFQLQRVSSALIGPARPERGALEVARETAGFDLALDLVESPGRLGGRLEYSTD